jgi:hypothetical protein
MPETVHNHDEAVVNEIEVCRLMHQDCVEVVGTLEI